LDLLLVLGQYLEAHKIVKENKRREKLTIEKWKKAVEQSIHGGPGSQSTQQDTYSAFSDLSKDPEFNTIVKMANLPKSSAWCQGNNASTR
jgi:hypothetical protein